MQRATVVESLYAGVLLAVVGLLAWVSGRPFVFPSLGPSGYLLATVSRGDAVDARRVVGGHVVGVAGGLAAYHALASGLRITTTAPTFAFAQLRLVTSGVVAVTVTTAAMIRSDLVHPPACATTLIVALGLLSSAVEAGIVVASVLVLVGVHRALGPRVRPAVSEAVEST